MAKKDYDRWCKGKEGREHEVETVRVGRFFGENAECGFHGTKVWVCVHVRRCSVCDRVLVHEWNMPPEDCPDFPG